MKRLWCRLAGCYTRDFPCCERCGREDHYLLTGWWPRLTWNLWRSRKWCRRWQPWGRCIQCRRFFWGYGYNDACSEVCFNKWIPF